MIGFSFQLLNILVRYS